MGTGGSMAPQGGGLCVPQTALEKLTQTTNAYYNPSIPNLKVDTCAQNEKCVPEDKVKNPGHCYDACMTSKNTVLLGGNDKSYSFGACTPPYVISERRLLLTFTPTTNGAASRTGGGAVRTAESR
jgi:hypothetical protein